LKPTLPPDPFNTKVTLLELERFAEIQARKEILNEIDIASEIFIARNCCSVYYADLMDFVPPGTASKSMLLSWLNDSKRKHNLIRPGVVTLYRYDRPDHFPGGIWSANRLCQYVEYLAKKLTDKGFVRTNKRACLFRDSLCNTNWFFKAVAVCGLKLLEDCYRQGALKSDVAQGYLSITFKERDRMEDTARVIGRCTKNHEVPVDLRRELREIAEESIKHALRTHLAISADHEEQKIFEKWEPSIRAALSSASENVAMALVLPHAENNAMEQQELGFGIGII
jgi:hypothetical protein